MEITLVAITLSGIGLSRSLLGGIATLGLVMAYSASNSGFRYLSLVWGRHYLVKNFGDLEVGS